MTCPGSEEQHKIEVREATGGLTTRERAWSECSTCGGAVARYNACAGWGWYHLYQVDWADNPHHVTPGRLRLQCSECGVARRDEDQDVCFHCSEAKAEREREEMGAYFDNLEAGDR